MDDVKDPALSGATADERGREALRRSEERLRLALDAGRIGVWDWDVATGLVTWSDQVAGFYGMEPGEFDGTLGMFARHLHPEDADRAHAAIRASVDGGAPYRIEYRIVRKGGEVRWINSSGHVVRDGAGRPVRMIGATSDVTDRRRAEDARRESEGRFRALFEQAPFSVQLFAPDGRTLGVNRAWEELWGLTLAQLGDYNLLTDPQLEAKGVAPFLRRAAAGEAVTIPAVRYDPEETIPGRTRHADPHRWVSAVAYPLRDAAGHVREVVLVHQDITGQKRAEQDLARMTSESERRKRLYEAALNNTPDLVYVFDLDHRFTYANEALLRVWGRAWDEAIGRTCLELGYEPWHAEMHGREIDRVRATKAPVRGEVPFTGTTGRRVYDYIFVPVLGADGAVEAVAGTTRDVTDRKRHEESLRHSEELLRLAADAAELGVWVWDVSEDRVTWENDRPYEIFGLDRSAGPVNAARFRAEFVHPDDAGAFGYAVEQAVRTGDRFYFQGRLRRPDGELRWVEFTGRPVRAAEGAPLRMHGTAADVTERKRAEEALRASEAEFRATFEGAGVGKAQAEPETGRLVRVNPKLCELLGYAADELLGMTIRELTHPDERADATARFRALVAGEVDQYAVEKRYLRKGGEVVWVRVTATMVRAPDGRPVRASAIIEDVTARILAEAALKEADRKKDDFIALLAHELRNPLAPIRNGLQVIRLSEDRAARERSQAMMDRQLTHMVRLIDDLLDISRITRNKMELRRARVALADVVGSAVETARPALDAAGHELTLSLPARPVLLDADPTRLSQVFSNLLTNSAKYTTRGGKIWLAAERTGGGVAVSVRDTGIGIPASALPTIFDMFSQVDRSIERSAGGLGIGLALVKGLVEMHGGTVEARSEGQGRGSTFVVTLPVQPAAPEPAHAVNDERSTPSRERRVLVVDDNRDGAESLAEMLQLLGSEVATAHDGLEAVEQAERFRPEVVLMDIGMPKLNGLDATRRIRGQAWGRDMTIIALTGWGQESDRARTREAGCDGHLVKPVNLTDLEKVLTELRPSRG
ncbi:hybrid sensor histidine kinase/response regulator [Gemmata sp.]|uniref:PAS domain-containing hybrid sensor histidine kinase/response regulator n=1 Tax=Gemmata sp. TaxID=1914242 RepID=UPI003F71794C